MSTAIWIAFLFPAALAVVTVLAARARVAGLASVAASAVVLACGITLTAATARTDAVECAGGVLRADALSAFMLTAIGAIGLVSTWGALDLRPRNPRTAARLQSLLCAFLSAMSLAVLADNLGLLWVAVEATTITTAFLVGHYRTRHSLEAAWKYVVLGSTGVAIAFLGIVVLYGATVQAGTPTLSWTGLTQIAGHLDPGLMRLAAGLAVLGFATKAGLAPLHSWLPDAHGQAPAAVSGLMSGVLLAVAFYAILRIQVIADLALGPGLMRAMLVSAGLASLAVAALLLIRQQDYKRMLAYSSIEHVGLLALGAAAGGTLAITAVLLHILGHGLTKSSLFVLSGRLLRAEGTARIASVHGLLARRPKLARPFLIGLAALLGFPPFSLFFSELGIIIGGWQRGLGVVMGAALVLLLVAFAALSRLATRMSFGAPPGGSAAEPATSAPAPAAGPQLPVFLALGVTAVIGFLTVPVGLMLARAAETLAG